MWYTFDPRNNVPRIGWVLIARGRDAADVALHDRRESYLNSFTVRAEELWSQSCARVRAGAPSPAMTYGVGHCSPTASFFARFLNQRRPR